MDAEKVMDTLLETIKEAKDFTLEQAPLVAKELLTFRKQVSVLTMSISAFFMLCLPFPILWAVLTWPSSDHYTLSDAQLGHFLTALGCGAAVLVSFLIFTDNLVDYYKITSAPRLYLLDYLRKSK